MVLAKAGQAPYYEAEEQTVNDIPILNYRNARTLPSAIPETL
jgi:hypothetical protein